MKKNSKILILIIIILLFVLILLFNNTIYDITKTGGDCIYEEFYGECNVLNIIENSIEFIFIYKENLFNNFNKEHINDYYIGYLNLECLKDVYPITQEKIKECNITNKSIFDCKRYEIKSGTCTPINYEFFEKKY
jgi:hypothetical protein